MFVNTLLTIFQKKKKKFKLSFIDVPINFSVYPYYHKNRPRFFNMATLYTTLITELERGAKQYLQKVQIELVS